MSLHHQPQTVKTFASVIPLTQILVYNFGRVIQNLCSAGFDEDHFV